MRGQLITWLGLGSGLLISAFAIPGQWVLIVILGTVLGFATPFIAAELEPKQKQTYVPPLQRPIPFSRKAVYGLAIVLAATSFFLLWLIFKPGSADGLPVPFASTLALMPGFVFGLSIFVATSARKIAS